MSQPTIQTRGGPNLAPPPTPLSSRRGSRKYRPHQGIPPRSREMPRRHRRGNRRRGRRRPRHHRHHHPLRPLAAPRPKSTRWSTPGRPPGHAGNAARRKSGGPAGVDAAHRDHHDRREDGRCVQPRHQICEIALAAIVAAAGTTGAMTIGRAAENDIVVSDVLASRQHAMLVPTPARHRDPRHAASTERSSTAPGSGRRSCPTATWSPSATSTWFSAKAPWSSAPRPRRAPAASKCVT